MAAKPIVLAFSGGLDTSFCVPWLRERGYSVYTLFCDTGGSSPEEREQVAARARELGAVEHRSVDCAQALWDEFVVPLVRGGQWYQGQYPLLVSTAT
jgi:argininosuccinate synthase